MPYRWTLTNLSDLTTQVLTRDPIGWDEGTYSIKRSDIYKGAFHEYTTSLKFHCDGGGKGFVDTVYQNEDIDGRIDVLVEYDCDGSGTYDTLFNGIINLASYKTDGEYTIVNIEKSDLLTKLFNRDEISVDLETTTSIGGNAITSPTPTTLQLHSQNIFLKSAAQGAASFTASIDVGVVDAFTYRGLISHQLTNIRTDAENFAGWNEYSDYGYPGQTKNTSDLPEIFEATDSNVDFPATYTYRLDFSGLFHDIVVGTPTRINSGHSLTLAYGATLNTATTITLYSGGGYTTGLTDYTSSFDTTPLTGTIALNYGDKVWLYWFQSEVISTGPYNDSHIYEWDYDKAEFSLEINSTTDETSAKTMLVHEAFNQVVDAIADSNGNFKSDFYGRTDSEKITYAEDGCGSKVAITNGLNIRKIEDKNILCSFKSLFENFDCLHNIGMGIVDSKVRVEPLSYWFDGTTQIISLPLVNSFEQKNDNRRYFNKIDIGYMKWESEFLGGLDDPNTKHEYSTIISSAKNTLTKLASYISSGYTIEFTRRKWNDVVTEDWRYDNDNFVIAVNKAFTGRIRFTAPNSLKVNNAFFTAMEIGDILTITGTASNNVNFTVSAVVVGEFSTTITVVEAVVTETANSASLVDVNNSIYASEKYLGAFTYGAGMTSLTTAYNLRLTPARMLQSHLKTITAGLQIIQGDITFVNGEGNTDLECSAILPIYTDGCETDYRGQQLKENQSFAWNDSNVLNIEPIWLPETYTFEYPLTYQQFKTIKANPYGYVEFYKFAGDVKSGFILNMEYKMKTGMTKFELLKRFQ
jgi:hypothetical protein